MTATRPNRYVPAVSPATPSGWSVGQCRDAAAFHLRLAGDQRRRLLSGDRFARFQHDSNPTQFRRVIRHHLERAAAWREAERRAVAQLERDKARAVRDLLTYGDWSDRWRTVYLDGRPVATIEARRVYDREAAPYRVHATDGGLILSRHLFPTRMCIAEALVRAGRA